MVVLLSTQNYKALKNHNTNHNTNPSTSTIQTPEQLCRYLSNRQVKWAVGYKRERSCWVGDAALGHEAVAEQDKGGSGEVEGEGD